VYHFFFLINPISGGGQGKFIYDFIPEIMSSMHFKENEWHAEFTQVEDLDNQIQKALDSTETLIAVGGDGTISHIFSKFLEANSSPKLKIGLVPLGTGNDLARVLNLYKNFLNKGLLFLFRNLVSANTSPLDIWKVNGQYALVNYFSSGIDARIAHDFNKARKLGLINSTSIVANKMHYVKRFIKDRHYFLKEGKVTITNPCTQLKKSYPLKGYRTIIIGNIPSFASGSNPFYKSNKSDKVLEVVMVPNLFSFVGAILLGNIPFLGVLYKKYFLKSIKASAIELELEPSEFHQLDGEDMSQKLGEKIIIEYGSQAQILSL